MRDGAPNSRLGAARDGGHHIRRGAFWTGLALVLGVPLIVALALWAVPWRSDQWQQSAIRLLVFAAGAVAVIAAGELCGGLEMRRRIERKEAELEALRLHLWRSERRFEALLNQSAVGIGVAGMDGRLLVVNERLCGMLGFTCDELRHHTWHEITDPEDLPAAQAQGQRLIRGEIDSFEMEKRLLRRDGSTLWAHMTCSAVRGDIEYVVAIIQDISERKRAQDALRESEARFRTLAEHARAAIGIVQGKRFLYANEHFAQLSGYSTDELTAMDFPALIHPRYREMVEDLACRRQLGEPMPGTYELEMLTRSGESRWIELSASLIELNGMPAIIGAGFEITSRKLAEEALRASERRLAEARDAAEAANRAKDQFLAVLSHELRTPLTPVLATASALQQEPVASEEARENLAMICRNVELEARLIDDLLDLTRLTRGKMELRLQPVQIAMVLKHTVEICANEMAAKGLQLHVDLGEGGWWLRGDPPRLQQVFWNLLNNSVKFTPSGGRVDIRVVDTDDGSYVTVAVADTGVGIAPEVLPRIFGAFEQGSRLVTQRFGGLGLGLAISKAVVEMHGGTISAHSDGIGKGAMFRVVLPTIAPPAEEEIEPPAELPARGERRVRILLVEDHADTAKVMGRLLQASGHTVRVAESLASALEAAMQEEFDLIISDLGLPDGSGLELMRRVRENQNSPKGIALSGFGMDEDIARSRSVGFAEHLTKPISIDQLEAAIARVLA